MKKVIIIGAGLAGLSLATELANEGFEVTVLEKNKYLGGRASNTVDKKMHDPVPIGPHIFLTCYNNFLRFLKQIGAEKAIAWERELFLEIIYNGKHHQTRMPNLPAPFYTIPELISYKFMSWKDKLSNIWLTLYLYFISLSRIEELDEINAYDFLRNKGVSEGAVNKFWRFFVFSMLNVPLELCSAAEFCLLVRLWAKTGHRHVGFVKVGLGDLYTNKAAAYLKKRKGKILLNAQVKQIFFKGNVLSGLSVEIDGVKQELKGDLFVSALNPVDLRSLLPEKVLFSDFFRCLNAFEGVPYISVNLWFDKKITKKKFWAILDDSRTPKSMNTDFYDQSNIYKTRKKSSYITSNIIYSRAYDYMTDESIIKKTIEELHVIFPHMEANLEHSQVHRIPYVIYAPYPGMRKCKLPNHTPYKNFYITGDWTVREMTQSMEAAVRSGYKCAESILKDMGVKKKIYHSSLS